MYLNNVGDFADYAPAGKPVRIQENIALNATSLHMSGKMPLLDNSIEDEFVKAKSERTISEKMLILQEILQVSGLAPKKRKPQLMNIKKGIYQKMKPNIQLKGLNLQMNHPAKPQATLLPEFQALQDFTALKKG